MSTTALHIEGGIVSIGESGISLAPWFTRRVVHIAWGNVMFVSPVPGIRYRGGEWSTFRDEPLSPNTMGRSVEFYSFEVALNDRHDVLASKSLFVKMWLLTGIWLKPLFTADDKPHPNNGCITLRFPKRWVKRNGEQIIAALETVRNHSRFDLLVSD